MVIWTLESRSPAVTAGLPYWWTMIFSENRFPLFGIMLKHQLRNVLAIVAATVLVTTAALLVMLPGLLAATLLLARLLSAALLLAALARLRVLLVLLTGLLVFTARRLICHL